MKSRFVALLMFFFLFSCSFQAMSNLNMGNEISNSNSNQNQSNHSGFVIEVNPITCDVKDYFGIDNTTVFYTTDCGIFGEVTNIFSINGTTETNLMTINGWEFEDAVYLDNGTILFALSKSPCPCGTNMLPFSGSNYDSTTFIIGYLLPDGTIGELPNSLDFSMDVRVKFDMYGNAFLIGSASDRTQSATLGSTSLGWTSVAGGTGCWSVSWISPKFIAHYNYTSSSFDWVFTSNYVTPDWQNGAGLGINKATSVLFFVVSGTAQVSYTCGSTPGTHTFGSHTTSQGQIIGAVDGTGNFLYAYNPIINIESLSYPGDYYYAQPVGPDSFVTVYNGGNYYAHRAFYNSSGDFTIPSDAPSSCNHQTNTSYLIGGNHTNYSTDIISQSSNYHTIHVEKTRQSPDHFVSWCLASSSSMLVVDKTSPFPENYDTFTYILMNDNDNDDFADIIDEFPSESTQWIDSDGDGWGDNWAQGSWNVSRTGGIGEWVDNAQLIDECPLTPGTSQFDRGGCIDGDGDGYSDSGDQYPNEQSQWADSDGDSYGDNQSGIRGDSCPNVYGESTRNSTYGCLDGDFDGWADSEDVFPYDSSQWSDWDGDGFGDELIGYEGDACPSQYGNSTNDRYGCLDDDGDGWSNGGDDFINNPTQYSDLDGDGYGDNQSVGATMSDAFPNDGTQWNDTDGDGHGDNPYGNQGDKFPNDPTKWQDTDDDGYANEDDAFVNDPTQWNDTDGDGYGDEADGNRPDAFPNDPLEWQDSDGDGYGNNADAFPVDGTQWNDTDGDGYGDNPYGTQGDWFPNDPNRWQDSDQDGYADEDDAFINDATQWNDTDGDGYGDEANGNRADEFPNDPLEWQDSDGDGYGNNADAFPVDGTQWNDTDGDGYGDNPYGTQGDWFPNDPNRWQDSDRDGYADEDDLFPNDISQWNDTDGDGYGDNLNGTNGDVFPDDSNEWKDSDEDGVGNNADQYPYDPTQTVDSDGDGYGDNINGNRGDAFPQDDTEWSDIDNDGYGDNSDLFLTDGTQWNDTDGDGFGDNLNGANGDACPLISGNSSIILLGCVDTDGDGYADQIDAFISDALSWSDVDGDSIPDELDAYPNDATQSLDSDGDGFGDNPLGTNADKFPNDATQWNDIDGDGFGDNLDGNNPDLFNTDATQWADSDGDGYGDNPQGRLYDMFPDNPTQWLDEDGDGLGDNQSGTDADPFLNDFDNDGFNDAIDILPKLSSPGDLDADGCLDEVDAFPENPQECVDTDNDGVGDNADSDDDDDGWTDADEIRLNADPLSASNQPVDSFEIVIPGTAVGLGAWDLIGIFGGVPLFAWIAFGFATRNGRCDKYEELLRQATSRDELEQVALRWEYSLMLRMLGPHQGIRLERLRSELDDKFEFGENTEPEDIGVNQTSLVEREAKELPPIEAKSETQSTPSKDTPAESTDDEGYEWLKDESGMDWYRASGSGDEWAKFES
jgi:hypothetical protein